MRDFDGGAMVVRANPEGRDGAPVLQRQTVWDEDGRKWTVEGFRAGVFSVIASDGDTWRKLPPRALTHEEPDREDSGDGERETENRDLGEGGRMSITDGLRSYVNAFSDDTGKICMWKSRIEAFADSIDAKHAKSMSDGIQKALSSILDAATEDGLAEHGLVRLPTDADGKAWHIGDEIDGGRTVRELRYYGDSCLCPWFIWDGQELRSTSNRHASSVAMSVRAVISQADGYWHGFECREALGEIAGELEGEER